MLTTKRDMGARAFDAMAGEAALNELKTKLLSLPGETVSLPNSDVQDSAVAALALVDVARAPERQAKFALLPKELYAPDTTDELERAAWALWFAQSKLLTENAEAPGAKIDVALYDQSGQQLAKMMKVVDYHVGEIPAVAAELADIRSGMGYQDRASDLVRIAALWDVYRQELEKDPRNYHPEDGARARTYAAQIVQSLRASAQAAAEWADLRNRAWTHVNGLYAEVKDAGDFLFRHAPEQRALFVPLRQAVAPKRPRSASAATTVAEPIREAPATSDVAPVFQRKAGTAQAVKEGFPGGSPFIDEE